MGEKETWDEVDDVEQWTCGGGMFDMEFVDISVGRHV